ncbi:MBL fold metallo-hydrolase [Companilactobacillus kimchiensis]|uniref:Metallo-beta-lactamase domain-containing protein n=1 Tax=Companilactobacillus kimchiensis TaxID=993692 RepID=A0A0R2LFM4_9LACO|nr:MBL fold metallo-hydrolase [Companilactobacillus kimchiensis]KRO00712.1 hypothetical protein IV57_GL000028 [Companilactobacillus kimchiensis]
MRLYVQPVRDIFQTNAYFYINEENNHGCLIDPGEQSHLLNQIITAHQWTIDEILLTHGHFDHTGAVDDLTKSLDIPFYIHTRGVEYLQDDELNLSKRNQRHINITESPDLLQGGDKLTLKNTNLTFDIIYTPGHSFDSVTYFDRQNKIAFVGDVLYNDGPGIWQFPGGDRKQLKDTINQKIEALPNETQFFVGHTGPMNMQQVHQSMLQF